MEKANMDGAQMEFKSQEEESLNKLSVRSMFSKVQDQVDRMKHLLRARVRFRYKSKGEIHSHEAQKKIPSPSIIRV